MEIRSFCPLCTLRCPLTAIVEGKQVTGIEELNSIPGIKICHKGKRLTEVLNSPKRLTKPLKRVGARGNGQWQVISWDEALTLISEKTVQFQQQFGSSSLAWDQGYGQSPPYLIRFLNLLGSPNLLSRSNVCSTPRRIAQTITYGGIASPDVDNSRLIIIWGRDKLSTAAGASKRLLEAIKSGARLIVVDPRKNSLARIADLWLPLRPGTDGALALGMMHVLFNEALYDQNFVESQCVGFEDMSRLVSLFPPERTAKITGLPVEDIVRAARLYFELSPSSIEMGNALDQHTNCFQSIRAILCLIAVSGNLNAVGGNVIIPPVSLKNISCRNALSDQDCLKRIGNEDYPILSSYRHTMAPSKFINSILENHSERPRILIVTKGNPAVTLAQSELVKKALHRIDFIVVSDFVITETARWADLVLPAAFQCEGRELVLYDPATYDYFYSGMPQGILLSNPLPRPGETMTDTELVFALAERLGLKERFWNGNIEKSMAERLEPLGLDIEALKEKNIITFPRQVPDTEFHTPSRKVELCSIIMDNNGYPGIPLYIEPAESPVSRPDLLETYPLILTTRKSRYFIHSAFRWVDSFYRLEPNPLVEIHPVTAAQLNIKDKQRVEISTPRGYCHMYAKITENIQPEVVCAVHGWESEFNVNRLSANEPCDPVVASTSMKSMMCSLKPLSFNC